MTFSRRATILAAGEVEHELPVQAGDGVEVEALEALHRREPRGLDPAVDHPRLAVEQLQLDQPGEVADMIDVLGGAVAGELLVLAQHRRQLEPLEVVAQQDLRRLGRRRHRAPPPSSAM